LLTGIIEAPQASKVMTLDLPVTTPSTVVTSPAKLSVQAVRVASSLKVYGLTVLVQRQKS
jgi:hypothetical protein